MHSIVHFFSFVGCLAIHNSKVLTSKIFNCSVEDSHDEAQADHIVAQALTFLDAFDQMQGSKIWTQG